MPDRDVRVMIRELDTPAPALIHRRGHRTLITKNAATTRLHVVEFLLDHLTPEEAQVTVAGYGLTFPMPNWTTSLRPILLYVPPALRLPNAPAFQGGVELERRRDLDDLHMERASYRAEKLGEAVDLQLVHDLTAV